MELISGQQNGTLRIWDLNKSECSKELIPDGEVAFRSVHFAPNGSTAVAANNKGTCFLWKMDADGTSNIEPIQRLQAHNSYLLKSVFSPNSKFSFLFLLHFSMGFLTSTSNKRYLATTSADKTIKIWSINKAHQFTIMKELKGHSKWVWDCVFSADSAYLVSGKLLVH